MGAKRLGMLVGGVIVAAVLAAGVATIVDLSREVAELQAQVQELDQGPTAGQDAELASEMASLRGAVAALEAQVPEHLDIQLQDLFVITDRLERSVIDLTLGEDSTDLAAIERRLRYVECQAIYADSVAPTTLTQACVDGRG